MLVFVIMTLTMMNFPSTPPHTTEPVTVTVTPEHPLGPPVLLTPRGQTNTEFNPLESPLTGPPSIAARQPHVGVRNDISPGVCRELFPF